MEVNVLHIYIYIYIYINVKIKVVPDGIIHRYRGAAFLKLDKIPMVMVLRSTFTYARTVQDYLLLPSLVDLSLCHTFHT